MDVERWRRREQVFGEESMEFVDGENLWSLQLARARPDHAPWQGGTFMRYARILLGSCILTVGAPPASAQLGSPITEARSLQPDPEIDSNADSAPSLVTDGQGSWVAAWKTNAPFPCASSNTAQYVVSTSFDDGLSWTVPWLLDPVTPGTASNTDDPPSIATDGSGTWVAVWSSTNTLGGTIGTERDILVARSTDAGLSWTPPEALNTNAATDGNRWDRKPSVATNGAGVWIAIWYAAPTPSPPGQFLENDIYVARSLDAGRSWSDPAFVNNDAATDDRNDWNPTLTTDGNDTWLAVWTAFDNVSDIHLARSVDDGETWSEVATLIAGGHYGPSVATDGGGNWMIAWSTNTPILGQGFDWDVLMSTSSDDARTWSGPRTINAGAFEDGLVYDARPAIAADGRGNWVAVWESDDEMGGTLGGDWDILVARSGNHGLSWTEPEVVNSDAAIDTGGQFDGSPRLVADGRANWVATWTQQLLDARAATFRVPFVETCAGDGDGDGYGDPGDPGCPLGAAVDCDDDDLWIAPGVVQACDGVNNDCGEPGWPLLTGLPETDDDGDGLSECDGDCGDDDGQVWSRPGEVPQLDLGADGGVAMLSWSPPASAGGTPAALAYDVIRSSSVGAYYCPLAFEPAACVESDDGTNTTALDADVPDPGQVFFYTVRADHACPGQAGSLGLTSAGSFRFGVDCQATARSRAD